MDLQLPSFSILIASFIFILVALKTAKKRSKSLRLPPGPPKLPILGNLHQLIHSVPHRRLRDLAKQYGPLMHLQLGEVSTVVASSAEAAEQFMRNHDVNFAQRPYLLLIDAGYGPTDIVFGPQGGHWRQLKKITTTELLSQKSVQSFRSIREEEVSKLVKLIYSRAGTTFNLSREIFSLVFVITTRVTIGDKLKDLEEFMAVIQEITEFTGGFSVGDVYPSLKFLQSISGLRSKIKKIHQKVDRKLEEVLREHKSSRVTKKIGEGEENQSLLGVLLYLQKHGDLEFPLTDENIKAVLVDVFAAGTEAPAANLEWTMSELVKNPKVMEKAQAEVRKVFGKKGDVDDEGLHELKYLKLVIKESMRLRPSVPLLVPRESAARCEIFGYEIPKKTKVIINAWAIARDPKYWSEPEKFMPERFAESSIDYKGSHFEYLPFGAGRRICPGITFGLANIEIALASILFHFDWKLPSGANLEDLDMSEASGIAVRRINELKLVPTPSGFSKANGRN